MPYGYIPNNYNAYNLPQYQQPMAQQQQNNGLIWVQGIEAMKSYPVAPGQSVLLMDSESNCFGIKTADASGMPLPCEFLIIPKEPLRTHRNRLQQL